MATISRQEAFEIYKKLEKAFRAWWTQLAEDTYEIAQNENAGFVPYKTGQLKESGYLVKRDTSFSIGYSAPYAGEVYNPDKYFVGYETAPHTSEVQPYIRQGKPVKGHSKTYQKIGQRPWKLKNGQWRTIDINKARANRPKNEWIQRAWAAVYEGIHPKDRKALGLKKRVPVQFPQSRINWRQ
tara:strand:+ start:302 stop:850 length:549 start_codon:yes stop_codon:yes gene_type:complete